MNILIVPIVDVKSVYNDIQTVIYVPLRPWDPSTIDGPGHELYIMINRRFLKKKSCLKKNWEEVPRFEKVFDQGYAYSTGLKSSFSK